jgi:hypothetical protein
MRVLEGLLGLGLIVMMALGGLRLMSVEVAVGWKRVWTKSGAATIFSATARE